MKRHWQNFQQVMGADRSLFEPISDIVTEHDSALPKHFTLLVWNVYKRNGGQSFDRDIEDLASRSHLLCLQEVLANKKVDLPVPVQALSGHYSVSYKRPDGFYEGVLTACRHQLSVDCHSVQSIGREPLTKTPKSALITTVEMDGGQQLLVINIHMLLFKNTVRFREELLKVVKQTKPYRHLPAIFAGDFNTFTPWQLVWLDMILKRFGFTRCKPDHRPRGARFLDHVYVRGLKVHHHEIIDTVSSSDHFPLLCELELI